MAKMTDGAWQNSERDDNDEDSRNVLRRVLGGQGGGGGGGRVNPYFCSRIPLPAL